MICQSPGKIPDFGARAVLVLLVIPTHFSTPQFSLFSGGQKKFNSFLARILFFANFKLVIWNFLHSITAIIDLVLSYFMNEGCFDILFIFNKDFVSKFAGDSKSSNLALQIMKNMIEMRNGDCDVGRTPRPAPCPVKAFCSVILPGFSQAAKSQPPPRSTKSSPHRHCLTRPNPDESVTPLQ